MMINQIDSLWWYKLNGLLRMMIVRGLCRPCFQTLTINEYPKSGGTWIGQMLSHVTGMPFPRNRLPVLTDSIMHGHYFKTHGMRNVLIVWRDGRDVLVSQYYHWLFENEKGNSRLVEMCRGDLGFNDYNDIETNLPKFAEYVFRRKKPLGYSWSDFVNQWINQNVTFVKYEDMRTNPVAELVRITKELAGIELEDGRANQIVENYSFEKQSGRSVGDQQTNKFLRKGIVGDWKNHYTEESRAVFKHYAGGELVALGYEKSRDW